jgi:hypothetical protein
MNNIPIEIQAKEILINYNGSNDYLLEIKGYLLSKKAFPLTSNICKYIISNQKVKPIVLNKKCVLHKSIRGFLKSQYKLDFIPEEIFINKLLTRKGDNLHLWACFNQDCKYYFSVYLDKNCIKNSKTIELPSFDQYDRPPKKHQLTAIKTLLENDKFILADDMGLGKMEFVDNQLFTSFGRKRIGDIIVGDKVIGSDGKPYNVVGVFPQGNKELFKVTFNDGYSILVGGEHLWSVSTNCNGENNKNRKKRYITLSTNQMLDKNLILQQNGSDWNEKKPYKYSTYYKKNNGASKWQIPIVKPIEFYNNYELPIEPYLLGVCLGDGNIKNSSVKFEIHKDDFEELFTGVEFNEFSPVGNRRSCNLNFGNKLQLLNINNKTSDTKFIPDKYKYSSIVNRIAILQGLMDTDGHCMKSKKGLFAGTEYATVSEKLADDIAEIVHSLGGIVRKKSKIGSYRKPDGTKVICKKCYRLNIKMPTGINPFRLKRKAILYKEPEKYKVGRYIKDIQPCGTGEAVCISVDSPDKLYVTEHAIVTHNTTSTILAAITGGYKRILVVCPASLKLNWKKEISLYDNPNDISIVEGSDFTFKKWTIVNYDILKNFHNLKEKGQDPEDVKESIIDFYKFDLVIADEAHYLKNATANRTKLFNDFAMKIGTRWLLTGTPITNKPIDLYNLLYLCESPLSTNWVGYVRRYCAGRQFKRKGSTQKYWVTDGATNLEELKEFTDDLILRRLKKDAVDLPQKTIKPIYLPLSSSRRYQDYMEEYQNWYDEQVENGIEPKPTEHLTQLIKVRQLLSEDKLSTTINLVEDIIESGRKVIIFSCFSNSIRTIHDHFGKKSVLIDGAVSAKNRDIAVEKFQNDDKIKVFCGNIVAAGVGLTLTEGSVVIFNDVDWTPANHLQAGDRAHRMGQTNEVHIIYPLIDGTLDTVMYNKLQDKIKNISTVMGDENNDIFNDTSMISDVIKSLKD